MISIIIPACNEEQIIARCIKPLLQGIQENELEVIVVCNGCTDKTAEIVASLNHKIKIIETETPSKAYALNLGDQMASAFPRFYLDADIVLPIKSVRMVSEVLSAGKALVAAPKIKINCKDSSWAVRSYFDFWQQLPYPNEGMVGCGVYALSREGRKRFEKFPDITSDDEYVRSLFTAEERCSVSGCYFEKKVSRDIANLLKIRQRNRIGLFRLWKKFPRAKKIKKRTQGYQHTALCIIKNYQIWYALPIYLYVSLLARIRARKYFKTNRKIEWARDESSRTRIK